jgi:hypothetical protein
MTTAQETARTPDADPEPTLEDLLSCYVVVLDAVEALARKRLIASAYGGLWLRLFTFRVRVSVWFVRMFAVDHITRNLSLIRRSYGRTAVLSSAGERESARSAIAAIDGLQAVLPEVRFRRTVVFALVLALLMLPRALSADVRGHQVSSLIDLIFGVLTLNYSAVEKAVALPPDWVVATLVFTLAFSIAIVLALPAGAFRLKRLAFAAPATAHELVEAPRQRPQKWPFEAATGAYAVERRLFDSLGIRSTVEVPYDLLYWGAVLAPITLALLSVPVVIVAESTNLGETGIALLFGIVVYDGLLGYFFAGLPLYFGLKRWRRRDGLELEDRVFKDGIVRACVLMLPVLLVLGVLARPLFRSQPEVLTIAPVQLRERSAPLGDYLARHNVSDAAARRLVLPALAPGSGPGPRFAICAASSCRTASPSTARRSAPRAWFRGRCGTPPTPAQARFSAGGRGPRAPLTCSGRRSRRPARRGFPCRSVPARMSSRSPSPTTSPRAMTRASCGSPEQSLGAPTARRCPSPPTRTPRRVPASSVAS